MKKEKYILLTGGTGFLGSHILRAFINKKKKVILIKRKKSSLWRISDLNNQYRSFDIENINIKEIFNQFKIDTVVHTACIYGRNNELSSEVVKSNLTFGLELLEAAIQSGTNYFFNTDTFLPKNMNFYTISKKQFVEWLQIYSSQIKVVNFKLEHMFGPKDGNTKFVTWLISMFAENTNEINLTKGEQKRDFIYVDDVVNAYLKIYDLRRKFDNFTEFYVGTGKPIQLKYFVRKLKKIYEINKNKVNTKLNFGALPYVENEVMESLADNTDLKKTGWSPKTKLSADLKKTVLSWDSAQKKIS